MSRAKKVAQSIAAAIREDTSRGRPSAAARLRAILEGFFALHRLKLGRIENGLFQELRRMWQVPEADYVRSLRDENELDKTDDMGYSGSTFFASKDGKYLIKSVSRGFENTFFRDDLLEQYVGYMLNHLDSLIVRITDFLTWQHVSIGGVFGLAPTHHIVMENLLTGRSQATNGEEWETWDLKPTSYFFPERDLASGKLASEATKSKLADEFDDKIHLHRVDADAFMAQLEVDTELLEKNNAVDYSLFLVRIPVDTHQDPFTDDESYENTPAAPQNPPHAPPAPPTWRTSVKSADGRHVFRAAILDFFWAKHKTHPKVMTLLVKTWNVVDKKGPMSITTTPQDYRDRFLRMCSGMIEVDLRMEDCGIADADVDADDKVAK